MELEKLELDAWEDCVAKRYDSAMTKFLNLAARGSLAALLNLGWMHAKGLGVPVEDAAAEAYYRQALEAGEVRANYHLGWLYRRLGDPASATNFFEAGAERDLRSTYRAGFAYLFGEGVEIDLEKARQYLERAASLGHIFARRRLGLCYLKGTFGKSQLGLGIKIVLKVFIDFPKIVRLDPGSDRVDPAKRENAPFRWRGSDYT